MMRIRSLTRYGVLSIAVVLCHNLHSLFFLRRTCSHLLTAVPSLRASQILRKGELQVSEKERKVANENLFHDIAMIVAQKCVNKETKKPFPVNMIGRPLYLPACLLTLARFDRRGARISSCLSICNTVNTYLFVYQLGQPPTKHSY